MTHHLKTWPEYFAAVKRGDKPFEIRKNDRDFQLDDTLNLFEWDPATKSATGRVVTRKVTFVLIGGQFGIEAGFCALGIR